jgi:hypothetical protein
MSQNLHGVVRADHPLTTDRFRLITWRDLVMVVSTRAGESPNTASTHPTRGMPWHTFRCCPAW